MKPSPQLCSHILSLAPEFFYPLDQIDTYATKRAVPSMLEIVVQGGQLRHAEILLLQPLRL